MTPKQASSISQACLADKIRLVGRVVTKIYDDALRPLGMTISQLNILVLTARFQPATPAQVANWLELEKSTLSRNVHLLREQHWLETVPGRGRMHRLRLTAQGYAVLKRALPMWKQAQREARSLLGNRGVRDVLRVAQEIRSRASRG